MNEYIAHYSASQDAKAAYTQSARAEFAKRSGMKKCVLCFTVWGCGTDKRVCSPYMLTIPQQVSAVMRRKVQIIRGNMLATGLNLL